MFPLMIELALAVVLVLVACWMKRYWLGGFMLVALCIVFMYMVPSPDSALYWVPFVLGVPTLIVVHGRSLPSAERERCAAECRAKYGGDPLGPSPLGTLFFAFLALLILLRMFSEWVAVDLADGQLTVEQRTWWGLVAKHRQWRADEVAKVDVEERVWRSVRGSASYFHSLVFKRGDGVVLYKTGGDIWSAKDRAALLMKALGKGSAGRFHDWAFQHVGPCLPFLFAFLMMTMILGRNGLLPPRKSRPPRVHVSKNGISFANVLSRPGR